MGRKSSKPFWARDYRKAAYNRRYYLKKKMQDKLASIGIMAVGGTMFLGWLLPTHNPAYKPDIHVISTKTVQAAAASPTYASFTRNVYLPDFSCTVDHSKDSIATLLCENSDAARHELIFDQTYYALRQIVGKDGWKALRQEVLNDENTLAECIASPEVGNTLNIPKADPACYITHMDNLTDKYKARLSGSSLEEANRPIDEHITLQQNLIDLGFLKQNQGADGVYGEGTRSAILKWQQSNATLIADGFISDADAEKIAAMAENLPSLAAQQPPRINDANRAVFNPFSIPYKQNNNSIWPVLLLISLICGGIFFYRKIQRKKTFDATKSLVSTEIFRQKLNLQISRNQKITKDIYGTLKTNLWVKEVGYFLETRIDGIIASNVINQKDRQTLRLFAINLVEQVSSDPLPVHTQFDAYVSNPTVFDIRMNPFDYEQHCALILKNAGWDAHATHKSGDQGADVIAQKGNIRIVVQCKLYTGTVGNDAVQQVFAAQKFQGAQGAIVATNSTFSQSARQAASATGVILTHHAQLSNAAEELYYNALQTPHATDGATDHPSWS